MAKGDCFDAAYQEFRRQEDEHEPSIMLCHGVVRNDAGEVVHAWVEKTVGDETYIFDKSNGGNLFTTRSIYYSRHSVRGVVRYDAQQVTEMYVFKNHVGPWDNSFEGM